MPCCSVKVTLVIESGAIASLKVAEIALLTATAVAPLTGTVELTKGATVSPTAPVLKLQT